VSHMSWKLFLMTFVTKVLLRVHGPLRQVVSGFSKSKIIVKSLMVYLCLSLNPEKVFQFLHPDDAFGSTFGSTFPKGGLSLISRFVTHFLFHLS